MVSSVIKNLKILFFYLAHGPTVLSRPRIMLLFKLILVTWMQMEFTQAILLQLLSLALFAPRETAMKRSTRFADKRDF